MRPAHAANNGKIFAWAEPPPTGHPGTEFGCRCRAEPYYPINDPPIEPVYPELLFLPFLRIPRLIAAWRAWVLADRASREWRMADYKSQKRWANQLEKGNWPPEKITATIKYGKRYPARNETVSPSRSATRYQIGEEFLVVDDTTKEIIQVSRPKAGGFIPRIY